VTGGKLGDLPELIGEANVEALRNFVEMASDMWNDGTVIFIGVMFIASGLAVVSVHVLIQFFSAPGVAL